MYKKPFATCTYGVRNFVELSYFSTHQRRRIYVATSVGEERIDRVEIPERHCTMSRFTVSPDNINPFVKACRYDVRGEIYLAAVKRAQEVNVFVLTLYDLINQPLLLSS